MDNVICRNKREIWNILNKNFYDIESKLMAATMMLNIDGRSFTYSCRRINSKNNLTYDYRLACNINLNHKLLIRFYYEPTTNKKMANYFGFRNERNIIIENEEQLNEIFFDFINNI